MCTRSTNSDAVHWAPLQIPSHRSSDLAACRALSVRAIIHRIWIMERSSAELQITVLSSERIKTVFAYDSILDNCNNEGDDESTRDYNTVSIIVDGTKYLCMLIHKSITTKSVWLSARKLLRRLLRATRGDSIRR